MPQYFGQYQQIIRRARRGSFGTLHIAVVSIISDGKLVENYCEIPRPEDAWRLGKLHKGQWISWEGRTMETDITHLTALDAAPEGYEAIASVTPVHIRQPGDFGASDMFQKGWQPPGNTPEEPATLGLPRVNDMFLREKA